MTEFGKFGSKTRQIRQICQITLNFGKTQLGNWKWLHCYWFPLIDNNRQNNRNYWRYCMCKRLAWGPLTLNNGWIGFGYIMIHSSLSNMPWRFWINRRPHSMDITMQPHCLPQMCWATDREKFTDLSRMLTETCGGKWRNELILDYMSALGTGLCWKKDKWKIIFM